ncbi:hypothetical protein A2Y85_02560 [candidate division WOR-3 bacterium RBG_13_43_14]|uniref:AAA+ ATPase domain-containing protein n=1 Tax=candidate division WOR-3 bacterium RBG_13_43_14 TaxID=1802590 RepID=A0A1F4U903_UNCW3|nr:MAG: hypothetical protein A2Y85_02560 [candidate division WOR-3 bacterium RBG_13_43_14]
MKRKLNLENFYVYDGNKIAILAIKKIIEFPGELFNPLYIYSATGLGKSHLYWALHDELNKKIKTLYFSIKDFEQYLEKTKIYDTPLIIDDLQSLDERFSELLLGLIDSFVATNRQICFSGNAAPRELTKFDSRLWSRLEGGLVCDIVAPKEFALVELIKRKSEEQGILLPDEVSLEIAQISTGSIRTIEGMINRLVAYSSLGNVQLDSSNVRMILKDFYPKGIYSPVSSLLEELKKNASEVLQQVSESIDERGEYREKIYIWEMKGFDTSSLKLLIDSDINDFRREYDVFIKKVEKLMELQKEYGSIDFGDHPDEAMQIESMLFSPDRVDEIESIISGLRKPEVKEEPKDPFAGLIIGKCNENAYRIYHEQITVDLGGKFNPFVIYGQEGCGKTVLLQAILNDLSARDKKVIMIDLAVIDNFAEDTNDYDVVLIDNFSRFFKGSSETKKEGIEHITNLLRTGKLVILSSEPLTGIDMPEEYKQLFDLGLEVELEKPSADVVTELLKQRIPIEEVEIIVQEGLPVFNNYYEIGVFVENRKAPAKDETETDLVPLGLPGEKEKADTVAEPDVESGLDWDKDEISQESGIDIKQPLKKLHEERLIIEEIKGEFVEENF